MNWRVKWFSKEIGMYDWEVTNASCGMEALRKVQKHRSITFDSSDEFTVEETRISPTF